MAVNMLFLLAVLLPTHSQETTIKHIQIVPCLLSESNRTELVLDIDCCKERLKLGGLESLRVATESVCARGNSLF